MNRLNPSSIDSGALTGGATSSNNRNKRFIKPNSNISRLEGLTHDKEDSYFEYDAFSSDDDYFIMEDHLTVKHNNEEITRINQRNNTTTTRTIATATTTTINDLSIGCYIIDSKLYNCFNSDFLKKFYSNDTSESNDFVIE